MNEIYVCLPLNIASIQTSGGIRGSLIPGLRLI